MLRCGIVALLTVGLVGDLCAAETLPVLNPADDAAAVIAIGLAPVVGTRFGLATAGWSLTAYSNALQTIRLPAATVCWVLRFILHENHEGNGLASAAEIGILPPP